MPGRREEVLWEVVPDVDEVLWNPVSGRGEEVLD